MSYTHQQPVDPNFPPLAPAPAKGKNWFARHKVLTGVGAFVIVAAIAAGSSGGSNNGTTTVETTAAGDTKATKTETKAKAEKPDTAEGLQADGKTWIYGDWKITNLKIGRDSTFDWFEITSDVTYLGDDPSGGDKCFDLTLDKKGRQLTSSSGCADSVQPGKTAKLKFISTEDYVAGPYEITLSKTW